MPRGFLKEFAIDKNKFALLDNVTFNKWKNGQNQFRSSFQN